MPVVETSETVSIVERERVREGRLDTIDTVSASSSSTPSDQKSSSMGEGGGRQEDGREEEERLNQMMPPFGGLRGPWTGIRRFFARREEIVCQAIMESNARRAMPSRGP